MPFLSRLVSGLIAYRWPLLGLALLLAAAAYLPSRHVRFDRSIERMFAPTDPLLAPYQRLKRDFGGNEVVMAVYQDDHLLDPDGRGLERLAQISHRMKQVPGVRDVLSLAEINALLERLQAGKNLGGILDLFKKIDSKAGPPILDPNSKLAARYRDLFAGYTHSTDGKTAALVCMLSSPGHPPGGSRAPTRSVGRREEAHSLSESPLDRSQTIDQLDQIIHDLPGGLSPGFLAGEPVMIAQGFSLLEADGRRLGTSTTILLGLTILVFFRSLRWLIVPIAVVQWALIATQALLVISGLSLSMVSSMLTAIVTVVGVATVMHLIVHVRELRTQGLTQREAFRTASVWLAGPIVGAILTDVAGFGSLCFASVEPVRDFGTMMVVGSLLVVPAICLLVPALALAGAKGQPIPKPGWGEVHIGALLMRSIDAVHAHPRTIALITAIVALIASIGVTRLEVETDFTRNFRRGSRVVKSYEFVETHLGGAGVWDVILLAPHTLDADYLSRVRNLQQRLRALETTDAQTGQTIPALTKVISLVDAIDAIDAEPALAALTPTPELRYQALAAAMPTFMAALRSTPSATHQPDAQARDPSANPPSTANGAPQPSRLRIMLRARERQPAQAKQRLIQEVTRLANEAFPPATHKPEAQARGPSANPPSTSAESTPSQRPEVTGFFVLLTNLIQSIIRDQWVTFAIASAAIMAMVWIGFRSWKYAVVAMIPNAVPIYMVMGLLGWLGLKINMGAAMIAAVSMGMSVDSSIHYYASFRRARREGKSVRAALAQCQQSVGLAMIFSTIALIVGFGVLVTSEFVPTIYFGALMSLAMLGGMLGNLIVLPLLLSWTEHD